MAWLRAASSRVDTWRLEARLGISPTDAWRRLGSSSADACASVCVTSGGVREKGNGLLLGLFDSGPALLDVGF